MPGSSTTKACILQVIRHPLLLCANRSGIVTKDMIDAPNKKLFLWIGGLEAVSQLLGFIGAAKLPGEAF